jgi:endonuclease/exonuclease/phosphatase family metal-dependent hydrolase
MRTLFVLVSFALSGCGTAPATPQGGGAGARAACSLPVGSAKIATLNMRWLNDELSTGIVKRTEADYAAYGRVLEGLRADIVGLQELEDVSSVQALILNAHMSGKPYNVLTNQEGAQEIGVLWNTQTATVERIAAPAEFSSFTRTPLFVSFSLNGFDGTLVVVHLKAGSDSASRAQRAAEMNVLQTWMLTYSQNQANDPDVVALGDFNFSPQSGEYQISSALALLVPGAATTVSGSATYDFFLGSPHAAVSFSGSALVQNCGQVATEYGAFTLSDHWPVVLGVK